MDSYAKACRLCLDKEASGVELFKGRNFDEYSKPLTEVFQIELQDIPGWPVTACSSCIQKLEDAVEFKAAVASSQEKLVQLFADIRIKCEPVDVEMSNDKPSFIFNEEGEIETEIVSEVWIKEEIFPDNEKGEESSWGDEPLPSCDVDNYAPGSSTEEEEEDHLELPPKKRKTQPNVSPITLADPKFEEMLRDLNVLQCQPCVLTFSSWSHLRAHLRGVHSQKHVHIGCCGLKFYNRVECSDHMRYHLNEDAFKCEECGKKWLSGFRLKLHKDQVHAALKFTCETCGKEFKTVKHLNQHVERHVDPKERPVKCTRCEKRFIDRSQMNRHSVLTHSKPTKCNICGKMVVHMDGHKKYKHAKADQLSECTVCRKKIPTISLGKHMTAVHSEDKVLCPTCGKQFKRKMDLKEHEDLAHSG